VAAEREARQRRHTGRADYRGAVGALGAGDPERIRRYAAELVAPDVIRASGSGTTGPLLQATRAVPVVFVQVADPVGAGCVPLQQHFAGPLLALLANPMVKERLSQFCCRKIGVACFGLPPWK
jgi:hypothetical protein